MGEMVNRKWDCDLLVGEDGAGNPVTSSNLIQVDSCLSKLNHRLYRQGRNYRAKVDLNIDELAPGSKVEVYALRPTWFHHRAWKLAKAAYDDALELEKERLGADNIARWRDFKVETGVSVPPPTSGLWKVEGVSPTVYGPSGSAMASIDMTDGMFEPSTAENLDNGNNMTFTWGYGSGNEYGVLQEYNKTMNESASPELIITDMPYHELDANAEVADYVELQANGSEPPYRRDSFYASGGLAGGVWCHIATLYVTEDLATNGRTSPTRTSTGFFDAMCGSIVVDITNPRDTGVIAHCLTVEVAKGDYRGVAGDAL